MAPLDGLRGVLAPSVFVTHAASYFYLMRTGVWKLPPSNFYGQLAVFPVCMFFFITGYLFWSKLIRGPSPAPWEFWLGRFARLTPAYVAACLCLFLMAACAPGFHRQVPLTELGLQWASWLSFRGGVDVNGIKNSKLWLAVVWTLQYEWLFYFSLPFLGWFARRTSRTLLLLAVSMAAAHRVAAIAHLGTFASALDLLSNYLNFLAFSFSVGIVSAMLPREMVAPKAQGKLAAILSFVAIGITLTLIPPHFGRLESLCLALPFMCVSMGNNWFGLLSSRSLRFLGRISYSFYLFHFLTLAVVMMALNRHGMLSTITPLPYWTIVAGCGTATIVLSAFSYQWLEAPFLHVGRLAFRKTLPPLKAIQMVPTIL